MRGGVGVAPGTTQYYLDGTETLLTVKSSISLTDEQHAFARALVETGRYSSLSAVLQPGVDLLRRRMDAEKLETAALRELLSRRRRDASVDAERMDAAAGRDGCREAPRAWSSVLMCSRSRPNIHGIASLMAEVWKRRPVGGAPSPRLTALGPGTNGQRSASSCKARVIARRRFIVKWSGRV